MARNEVTLEGFVRKIELRFSASSGKAFLSVTVPVDRRRFDKSTNEWTTENTTWWQLTTVGEDAEYQQEELREGDLIQFTGLPELEKREGKDGRVFHNAVMKFPMIAKVLRAPKDRAPSTGGAGFGGQSGGFSRTGFQQSSQGGFGGGQDDDSCPF